VGLEIVFGDNRASRRNDCDLLRHSARAGHARVNGRFAWPRQGLRVVYSMKDRLIAQHESIIPDRGYRS
jgi:hypothetical protein